MTNRPFGFFQSDAIFARNLFGHAGGGCQIQLFAYLFADHLRNSCRCWKLHFVRGHIQVSFVERQRFDKVGMALKNLTDCQRNGFISSEVWRHKDGIWAHSLRSHRRHR